MAKATVTAYVDTRLKSLLQRAATYSGQSLSALAADALENYAHNYVDLAPVSARRPRKTAKSAKSPGSRKRR